MQTVHTVQSNAKWSNRVWTAQITENMGDTYSGPYGPYIFTILYTMDRLGKV